MRWRTRLRCEARRRRGGKKGKSRQLRRQDAGGTQGEANLASGRQARRADAICKAKACAGEAAQAVEKRIGVSFTEGMNPLPSRHPLRERETDAVDSYLQRSGYPVLGQTPGGPHSAQPILFLWNAVKEVVERADQGLGVAWQSCWNSGSSRKEIKSGSRLAQSRLAQPASFADFSMSRASRGCRSRA
jgi:hypothetical protein